jgi:TolB protein
MAPHSRLLGVLVGVALLGAVAGCAPLTASVSVADPADALAKEPPARELRQAPAPPPAPAIQQQAADVPAGRILYVRDGNLWMWQAGATHQFTDGSTWYQPSFSPDGSEIAYVYWTFNFSDIFVMTTDGTSARRLTKGQAASIQDNDWSFRPRWSPDGSQLAYVSDTNSQFPVVWLMNKDGSGRRQIMSTGYGVDWADALAWAPDGKRIAVSAGPGAPSTDPGQIWLLDIAKGTTTKLTEHPSGAFDPAWGPNGDTIAYIGRTAPGGEVWLRSLDGTKEAHVGSLPYVRGPVWSPDGKSLAVLAAKSGVFQIWTMTVTPTDTGFDIGEPKQLTKDGSLDASSGLTWAR